MAYVDGFVIPVPKEQVTLDAYKNLARVCNTVWREYGAIDYVETIGDDVPYGTLTALPRAVPAKEDDIIILSWIVYESRAARDACMEKVMADPRMKGTMTNQPFDGKRMIFGGFVPFLGL